MRFPLSEGLLRSAAREPTPGGGLRDRVALSKAANWGKVAPEPGLSGYSRIKIRSYDIERAERPEG
jgi:hypothetical protein